MNLRAFQPSRDFSRPEPVEAPAPEPEAEDDRLPPEEVARLIESAREEARREAYDKGYKEGQEAERASISAQLDARVGELHETLAGLRAREDDLFEGLETRTARLMLALVHQLAKRLSEGEAKRLAENVAIRAVDAVRGKHRITIRATEEFIEPLRAVLRLPTDADAEAHRIHFEPKTGEADAPLEVAWLTGKVTFDPYAFTDAIDEVFTETLKDLTGGEGEPLNTERKDV